MIKNSKHKGPKILLIDIETMPIIAHVWSLWNNDVALNQVQQDWSILSWSAKWLHEPNSKIMYADQRYAKNINDDNKLLKQIHKLMDEADIILGQNSKRFDTKKLNARFIINGYPPPSKYQQIDTMIMAKKNFAFTSNKLEYLSNTLGVKHKKLKTKKFPGHLLWAECMKGNVEAFKEMEAYNKTDVLALEDVYKKLAPWDNMVNLNVYQDEMVCTCGSKQFQKRGFQYSKTGKYQNYRCSHCGKSYKDGVNLLKDTKKILR
jgi:hypothetical protein